MTEICGRHPLVLLEYDPVPHAERLGADPELVAQLTRRQAEGELGDELRIGAKAFSVGDRVIFEKNQRVPAADLGRGPEMIRLRNGTFSTVVAVLPSSDMAPREKVPPDNALTR